MIYHRSVAGAKIYFQNFHRFLTRMFVILPKTCWKFLKRNQLSPLNNSLAEISSLKHIFHCGIFFQCFICHIITILITNHYNFSDDHNMIIILPDAGTYICTADNGVGPPVTAIITCHVICECHHRHHRHHRHHFPYCHRHYFDGKQLLWFPMWHKPPLILCHLTLSQSHSEKSIIYHQKDLPLFLKGSISKWNNLISFPQQQTVFLSPKKILASIWQSDKNYKKK